MDRGELSGQFIRLIFAFHGYMNPERMKIERVGAVEVIAPQAMTQGKRSYIR